MFFGGGALRKAHNKAQGGAMRAPSKKGRNRIVPLELPIKCFINGPPGSAKAELAEALARSVDAGGLGAVSPPHPWNLSPKPFTPNLEPYTLHPKS